MALQFPDNIVQEFKSALAGLGGIDAVVGRRLRMSDSNACVGVFAEEWLPGEMGIGQPMEPLDNRYTITIQLLIKHAQEEEALSQHSVLSKSIRVMVYRDPDLRVRLPQLSETYMQRRESVQKWDVRAQRFMSNEIEGTFLYLSSTEVIVTTETGIVN